MTTDGQLTEFQLALLEPLAKEFSNIDSATAELARLNAEMTLPKGTIHVISDIHGEDKKLRHVINNASGTLRPLVELLFKEKMGRDAFQQFISLIFYPGEVVERLEQTLLDPVVQKEYGLRTLVDLFEIVRVLASRRNLQNALRVFPAEYRDLLAEILNAPSIERDVRYFEAVVDELVRQNRVLHLIHLTGRVIRNLAVEELIIGGDCWDRGPRGDRVVDYLMAQPNVSFVWGNHDMAWLGACLGNEALVAHVLRISLRYRRLWQLEEGYGIPVQPLAALAEQVYSGDSAKAYYTKKTGTRDQVVVARMHKAAAIMEFKLEGQTIRRHPEWGLEHRCLLHRIDFEHGTIEIDGKHYPLIDTMFPTIDPDDPYALSKEEKLCLSRIRDSFQASQKLWRHMRWMVGNGKMFLQRDENLIFHGCVPADEGGEFLPMIIHGEEYRGKALFKAIEQVVYRTMEVEQPHPPNSDLDLFWYLWSGPNSPLFGKDRITTFERDLISDKATHHEEKNPYFRLIHEVWFCDKILSEFGVAPENGLIVNGHVPVAIEAGEEPLKRSGKAITIDGAFSESYGDYGYTLVLEPAGTFLATHYHFESVEAAISKGADIVPNVRVIREWIPPKRVADSQQGLHIRSRINQLNELIRAYRDNDIRQSF